MPDGVPVATVGIGKSKNAAILAIKIMGMVDISKQIQKENREKVKKQREVENSVKFQRKVLMAAVSGAEFLNSKFDPFDIKLDGWAEQLNENIDEYDELLSLIHI